MFKGLNRKVRMYTFMVKQPIHEEPPHSVFGSVNQKRVPENQDPFYYSEGAIETIPGLPVDLRFA